MTGEHGCGIAVRPQDAEVFADALENLATDSEAREEMGKASRSLGEREFSRDLLVLRFCEWIEGHWNEKRTNLITHAF
ncbi:MAG: glycosyltransferase involved in cell wall biosynthesis [Verrucomicrobiales bacterium]|jgi:glycosyltransferase involved in cell wall biosynthesis